MSKYQDGVEIEFDPDVIETACNSLTAAADELASSTPKAVTAITTALAPWGEHIQQDAPTARDAVSETLGIETPVEMPKVAPIFAPAIESITGLLDGMKKITDNLTGHVNSDVRILRDTIGQHVENQELAVAAVDSIDSNIAGAK